jgi:hypothetical protein
LVVEAARRVLADRHGDARARQILAEGLLCRGLERDDPWALAGAIRGFEERLAVDPGDFFAALYLAEALERRFPLADVTVRAFERAAAVLIDAEVGAARPALGKHLRSSLEWLREYRDRTFRLLRDRERELSEGSLPPDRVGEFFTLVALTGPDRARWAARALEAHSSRHPDRLLDTFYRAEILRGAGAPEQVEALYRSAEAIACDRQSSRADLCPRIRRRLEQLEAVDRSLAQP